MASHRSRFMTSRHSWRFMGMCNRTRQRRCVWFGVLLGAAVVLMCLPFNLDHRSTPVARIHGTETPTTFTQPVQNMTRQIEAILNATIRKSNSSFNSGLLMDKSERQEDTLTNSWCEEERLLESKLVFPAVSLIFSLYNLLSEVEALLFMRHCFHHIGGNFTDDVIITAEDSLPRSIKELLEEVVDTCSYCRLYFFHGNIYKHRNQASQFARNDYLVFVDARTRLTKHWLPPLIKCLQDEVNVVVSPQLRLRYSDGSGHSEGFSRNEVTWDLGVSRGAVSNILLAAAKESNFRYINQTIISTEVFGINKKFFSDIEGFDIIPGGATGGEHVSFSLKVLNYKGNIVTSICSDVFLTILNTAEKLDNAVPASSDGIVRFANPSFITNQNNMFAYYMSASQVWLDALTTRYYSCAMGRQVIMSAQFDTRLSLVGRRDKPNSRELFLIRKFNHRYSSYGTALQRHLTRSSCQVNNLRYIINTRQPVMIVPTKSATFYGYIRTMDGMYTFGMPDNPTPLSGVLNSQVRVPRSSSQASIWGHFILTRNTSSCLGPFSFTNGAFIYRNVWCVTVSERLELTLARCVKGRASQLFSYTDYIIRQAGLSNSCVCARKSANVSSEILVAACSEPDHIRHFKLDVQFSDKCIK